MQSLSQGRTQGMTTLTESRGPDRKEGARGPQRGGSRAYRAKTKEKKKGKKKEKGIKKKKEEAAASWKWGTEEQGP